MAEIKIYRTTYCPYCDMAKNLFRKMDVEFEEIDVTSDPAMRKKLVEMTGGLRTVPQIFIDGEPIGGYTDALALYQKGELQQKVGVSQ